MTEAQFWAEIRRALLTAVRAIEQKYGLGIDRGGGK